jgi:hypothetical protein
MIKSDHHEGYIVAILMWPKWPKGPKLFDPLDPLDPNGSRWCGRPKGLIHQWVLDPPAVT